MKRDHRPSNGPVLRPALPFGPQGTPQGGGGGGSTYSKSRTPSQFRPTTTTTPRAPCIHEHVHGYFQSPADLVDYLKYTFSLNGAFQLVAKYGEAPVHEALDVVETKAIDEGIRNPAGYLVWWLRQERESYQEAPRENERSIRSFPQRKTG